MGAIMADIQTGKTVREWAQLSGRDEQTVMTQLRRRGIKGMSLDSELSAEQWEALYAHRASAAKQTKSNFSIAKPQEKRAAKAAQPAPVAEAEADWQMPSFGQIRAAMLDCLLIAIAIGHAGLIWYDCAALWSVPGIIGGGLAFGIVLATVMLATDPTKNVTSQYALIFALVVDAGAFWVHRPVFEQYDAPETVTTVLCGFLPAMSWAVLFLYRHLKNN